jgi:hypothetical protein
MTAEEIATAIANELRPLCDELTDRIARLEDAVAEQEIQIDRLRSGKHNEGYGYRGVR